MRFILPLTIAVALGVSGCAAKRESEATAKARCARQGKQLIAAHWAREDGTYETEPSYGCVPRVSH